MPAEKNRKFFDLMNGLKAVDYRNKDYFTNIDDKEKSLYSPYMIMRYVSSTNHRDKDIQEWYLLKANENINKHLFTLSSKHKKLCWILTGVNSKELGLNERIFHPWIKPMKRVPNKSLKKLQQMYPTWKESDLETLDKVITDRELEELVEAHGINE
jgi:hypothetical protein